MAVELEPVVAPAETEIDAETKLLACKTADVIERYGWYRDWGSVETGFCVMGAAYYAEMGEEWEGNAYPLPLVKLATAIGHMTLAPQTLFGRMWGYDNQAVSSAIAWNDHGGNDKTSVIETLRKICHWGDTK